MRLHLTRTSRESTVSVGLDLCRLSPDLKKNIETPLEFLNHMIETLAWRSCVNIEIHVQTKEFRLTHVICEDAGLALGEAFAKMVDRLAEQGLNSSASSVCGIDESLARVFLAFEGRALFLFDATAAHVPERVEDMLSADIKAFLEGFIQGARATMHLDLLRGEDPHHMWESAFRALGESLRGCLAPCHWRSGATAGVKGRVEVTSRWSDQANKITES